MIPFVVKLVVLFETSVSVGDLVVDWTVVVCPVVLSVVVTVVSVDSVVASVT